MVTATGLLNIIVEGAAVNGPRMTLMPNRSIGVNVKEEFSSPEDTGSPRVIFHVGKPRANSRGPRRYLNVYLEPADDFGPEQVASLRNPTGPEDESLLIDNVHPGRYWVRINSSRGFASSVSSGRIDLQRQLLVVGVGDSTSPIEVTMRDDWAEIEGTVEGIAKSLSESEMSQLRVWNQAASYESSAHVYLVPLPDSSGEFRDVWVSPGGKFNLQRVPPGVYRVLAFDHPQPELDYRDAEAMRAYDSKGQAVHLVAGQKERLRLQLISTSE